MSRPLRVTFQIHNGAEFTIQCHTIAEEHLIMAALEAPTPNVCSTCDLQNHGQCDDCYTMPNAIAEWHKMQAQLRKGFRAIGVSYTAYSDKANKAG